MLRKTHPAIRFILFLSACCLAAGSSRAQSNRQLVVPQGPGVSPDGNTVAFSWAGDIWSVPIDGGQVVRLTSHPERDNAPVYSPDGSQIAFASRRAGSNQVFVMPASGGTARQLTFHSEGSTPEAWTPDGTTIITSGTRDHYWKYGSRLFTIDSKERSAEKLLFDDYAYQPSVSPDGNHVLFVREGERWWRKGYRGARSAQVWIYNRETGEFEWLVRQQTGAFDPVWHPDGSGFWYCSAEGAANGARNVWWFDLESKETDQRTKFDDDLVSDLSVSADGSTLVFRHLLSLYRMSTDGDAPPAQIALSVNADHLPDPTHRRDLERVNDAAFTSDGLEIAFTAGGDLWVMETELKEPVRMTTTAEFETSPVFLPEDNAMLVVGWQDGQPDIMKVTRADEDLYWWQNEEFRFEKLTDDAAAESEVRLSPDGKHIGYLRERGDLWIRNLETDESWCLVESFSEVDFDFSPDGRWIAYARTDDDFNNDIWIAPLQAENGDHTSGHVNISRHPDDEYRPRWSPDGKLLAFSGRRNDDEVDIYYVWLNEEDDDLGTRDRKLKETLEKFSKARKKKTAKPEAEAGKGPKKPESGAGNESGSKGENAAEEPESEEEDRDEPEADKDKKKGPELPEVKITFEGIHRRLRRISNADSSESISGWSNDGKKLLFTGTVDSQSGTWSVEFPDKLTPKKVTSQTGRIVGRLKSPEKLLWISNGVPGTLTLSGTTESYSFTALQELQTPERFAAGFDAAWRTMRDFWYDEKVGNRNWAAVRRKYRDAAAHAPDGSALAEVISLMLGELNGSHLGFYPSSGLSPSFDDNEDWRPVTAHLGVRFDPKFKGPGIRIRDVLPDTPAEDEASLLFAGEVILSIDGTEVDPEFDLTRVLNGPTQRDIRLRVKGKGKKGKIRDVVIRPTSYGAARSALYRHWQDRNRSVVAKKAENIGYVHIQGMNWPSFLDFERELYDIGYGKDGLIIDVRDNGGGFTTDHLLTVLTQPRHAVTVPRGGGEGYPQSRMVYATWNKPIVVLCNQNSYSNAEIFSHAIKGLNRGRLVGVPTAGGVISTGAASVTDIGTVRLPFRGWYVLQTGEDMELNGARPHFIIWPRPTELPSGRDRQLNKAIQVLLEDIEAWKAEDRPQLRNATDRPYPRP